VREHLGAFIARMVREQAPVELHARPPLPGWLLKQYTSNPPLEGHEYEEPPEPPVRGLTAGSVGNYESSLGSALWTEGDPSRRCVFLFPTHDPARFLALGLLRSPDKLLFALEGAVQEQLGELIARVREEARVELYARLRPQGEHP
jgi:hypothetical protein